LNIELPLRGGRAALALGSCSFASRSGPRLILRDDDVTKADNRDLLEPLRLANLKLRPKQREADLVPYSYYLSHPEHRPRKQTRRRLRRRLIREG
jgi:hypothetical protein